MAVLLASASDLDDLIPTLVAYQIEWNKLRLRLRAADWPPEGEAPDPAECAAVLGGTEDDWLQLAEAWGEEYVARLQRMAARRLNLRIRMLGGSSVGYARMTRHWWAPVRGALAEHALEDRPMYFVSSNPHSMVNLLSGTARRREDEVTDWVESDGPEDLRAELARSATAAPTARGRTSSTSPRATSSRRSRPSCASRARRRSARSASPTSRRAPRCASPPR